MKSSQKGFGIVEILIVLLIVTVVSSLGFYVYHRSNHTVNNSLKNIDTKTLASLKTIPCNQLKPVVLDPNILAQSRADYIAAGFSADYFDSHFKLQAVSTQTSPDAGGTYQTLTWEVCFPNNAIVSHYYYFGDSNPSNNIEGISPGTAHDIPSVVASDSELALLQKCSAGHKLTDIKSELGSPEDVSDLMKDKPPEFIAYIGGMYSHPGQAGRYYANLATKQCGVEHAFMGAPAV